MSQKTALDFFDVPSRVVRNTSSSSSAPKKNVDIGSEKNYNQSSFKSTLKGLLDNVGTEDENVACELLDSFLCHFCSPDHEDKNKDTNLDLTSPKFSSHEAFLTYQSDNSVIHSLKIQCYDLVNDQASQSLSIEEVENVTTGNHTLSHHHKTIPELIDFVSLQDMKVDIEYALIASLHQGCQRIHTSVTACFLESFAFSLYHIAAENEVTATVLQRMARSHKGSETVQVKLDILSETVLDFLASPNRPGSENKLSIAHNNSVVLQFLLLVIHNRVSEAHALVCRLVVAVQELLPSDLDNWCSSSNATSLSSNKSNERGVDSAERDAGSIYARKLYVLFAATQLQLVLNILDLSFHNAVLNGACDSHVGKSISEKDSIVVKQNDSGLVEADSGADQRSEKWAIHEQLQSNLTHFATTHRSLLPVLSVAIRTGLVYVSLFERPDVLRLLLDPSGQFSSQQQDKYLTSISQKIAKQHHSTAATETGTETGIMHATPGAGSASLDAQQKELRGWADRDEGYKHLQKLTREQCNKLLMPQLPGAFIIRPHETNRDQFFLSFRGATEEEGVKHAIIRREIATDVTRGSSSSGGDKVAQYICGKVGPCGSLKQLLSEISLILSTPLLFDHVVKFDRNVLHPHHSLDINYHLLVHTLPKHLSSLLSTVSVDQYNRYKTNSTNINNEETALNTAMNRNSSSGLFNNLFEDEEEDSSSGDDDDISEGGDTAYSDSESDGINIDDDNDGIAAANKDGSDSPFSPAAASDQQEGDEFYLSENSSVGNNSPYTLYSPKEQQSSGRTEKDKNVWKDVSSKKITHRVRKFTTRTARANKLLSEDVNKWNLKKQSNSMNNLVERLVALLALREFLQQLGAAASRVVDSVYTTEIVKQHKKRGDSSDANTRHSSFMLEHITHTLLSDSALPATVLDSLVAEPVDAGPDKSVPASSALNRQVSLFAALTMRVTLCIVSAERALQGLIVPPLPRYLHYIPVPYSYPDPDRISEHLNNRYPDTPSSAGLLMAESLTKLIIRSMNSSQSVVARYIKFPGHGLGYGGTEYVADNCLEITELTQLLVKWRTVSLKYSSSTGLAGATVADIPSGGGMDGGSSGSRSATPVNAKSPGGKFDFHNDGSQAAAGGGNTSSGSVHSGSSGNSAGSSSLNSNVKKGLNDLKSNLKKMGSHLHIPHVHHSGSKDNLLSLSNNKASSHHSSGTGKSVDASYLERTIHICELLTKINAHLNVPITSTNAEYTQIIFSWLFSLGIIQQVTRLAEHAFALPTTYYKYVDLWEVRVLHDYSLASEKVKLGRHVYGACATLAKGSATSSDNSNSNTLTTVKSKTTTITTNVNSGGQSPINVTKNIVLSSDTLASAGSAGTAYKNTASPIVHNMLEFVSQLRRRYRSSGSSGNLDGNMSVTSASPYSYLKRDVSYLSAGTVEGGGCEVYRQSADYRASLMLLWESLGAEMYIISSIAGTANAFERENIPILSDNSSSGNSSSGVAASQVLLDSGDGGNVTMGDPYLNTLQRYMYRNALYSRLCFPHRYVPNIQVDIYNVKEILSVSSKTISSSAGATSPPMRGIPIGGGNAPLPSNHNYNANYNTLTPSVSAHGGSIEIFATIRLVKDNVKRVDIALLSSNKTVNFDGTVVTGSHKAETNRSTGTNSISSNASTIYRSSAAHSTKTQNTITSISNSVDYVWREQAIFRHALPEGLLYPHLPRQHLLTDGDIHNSVPHSHSSTCVNTATTQSSFVKPPLVKHSSSTGNLSLAHPASTATTTNTTSTTAAAGGGGTVFNATNLHLYHPHDKVVISVFERNFFSDHKLGEVEILLSELTDKKVIRDWYPLVTADKCVSWLIYLQIKLRFQLMTVDISPAPTSSKSKQGAAFYTPVGLERSSSGEKNKAGKLKSKKAFLGQMDDFF